MNLKHLTDQELLKQTKESVFKERQLLTQVLHHLKEVERRRLYSDLHYQSLFEYAVKELKYSEGQAGRRIQAMRLLKELPELESKIKAGSLSLSNISQAQSYFRESKKASMPLSSETKAEVLGQLENKSAREGQKLILGLQPQGTLPKEKQRPVSPSHTEVKFIMSEELRSRLEEVRSLLGPKGALMSFSELIEEMADLSLRTLKIQKFGKKRTLSKDNASPSEANDISHHSTPTSELVVKGPNITTSESSKISQASNVSKTSKASQVSNVFQTSKSSQTFKVSNISPTSKVSKTTKGSQSSRYISSALRYELWIRDKGQCTKCGGRRNLNVDHIQPFAMGGATELSNLRLLCFHCNQRHAFKSFGRVSSVGRLSK